MTAGALLTWWQHVAQLAVVVGFGAVLLGAGRLLDWLEGRKAARRDETVAGLADLARRLRDSEDGPAGQGRTVGGDVR